MSVFVRSCQLSPCQPRGVVSICAFVLVRQGILRQLAANKQRPRTDKANPPASICTFCISQYLYFHTISSSSLTYSWNASSAPASELTVPAGWDSQLILALTYVDCTHSQVDGMWTFVPEFLETATVCNGAACNPNSKSMTAAGSRTRQPKQRPASMAAEPSSPLRDKPLHNPLPAEADNGSVPKRTRSKDPRNAYHTKEYDRLLQQSDSE